MKNNKLKIGIIVGVCAIIALVCVGTIMTFSKNSEVGSIANGVGDEVTTMGANAPSANIDDTYTYDSRDNSSMYDNQNTRDNKQTKEETEYIDSHDALMKVKTNDISKTYNNFCQQATQAGAEIFEHVYSYNDQSDTGRATVAMFVPNEKYEDVLAIARTMGTVISENTYTEKVEVSSESASSESKQSISEYSYYGSNKQYDASKYSIFTITFEDTEPAFIKLDNLKEIAMIATNIFLGLMVIIVPVVIVVLAIVLINKTVRKSSIEKEQTKSALTNNSNPVPPNNTNNE